MWSQVMILQNLEDTTQIFILKGWKMSSLKWRYFSFFPKYYLLQEDAAGGKFQH